MAVVSNVETADTPELREFYETIERTSGGLGVLNVFKAMAHSPELMRTWWAVMTLLFTRLALGARERELAILRLFLLLRCEYGFAHHVRIGKRVGITDEEIAALADYETKGGFSEAERLLLRYTDATTELRPEAPELARELRAHLSEQELVELTFCIANWNLMARLLEPLAVETEPEALAELPAWWRGGGSA
jgi:4-carboxymuconolactone decarboxylase